MEEQKEVSEKGGTMRLGSYDCIISKESKSYDCYKDTNIKKDTDTGMSLITNTNLIWKNQV